MPVTPEQLLNFANHLSCIDDEAATRASVSRSYYAAYHASNQKYRSVETGSGMHRNFIGSLKNSTNIADRTVGYTLDSIYRQRIMADYRIDQPFEKEIATTQWESSKRLVEMLSKV